MKKDPIKVPAADEAVPAAGRLDRFLQIHFPDLSRTRLQSLIRGGGVLVNGATVKISHQLSAGDVLSFSADFDALVADGAHAGRRELTPHAMPLEILFEDEHLIVVNKAAGVTVHPGAGTVEPTLVEGILAHIGRALPVAVRESVAGPKDESTDSETADLDDEDVEPSSSADVSGTEPTSARSSSGAGGADAVMRPGIVHRLDRDTTGAMVIAKTPEAMRGLAAQFHARTNLRQYIGLLDGRMNEPEILVEGWLKRDPQYRLRFLAVAAGEDASKRGVVQAQGEERAGMRHARTLFRREATYAGRLTLAAMKLFTGRTHQIRAHARFLGIPVVGDALYPPPRPRLANLPPALSGPLNAVGRQLLHAWLLGFRHPITGEELRFEAPLPKDFADILDLLAPHRDR